MQHRLVKLYLRRLTVQKIRVKIIMLMNKLSKKVIIFNAVLETKYVLYLF